MLLETVTYIAIIETVMCIKHCGKYCIIATETPTSNIATHIFPIEIVTYISAAETSNCVIATETVTFIIATKDRPLSSESLAQVFYYECYGISKNTFSFKTRPVVASEGIESCKLKKARKSGRLHFSKVPWKFPIPTIYNFAVIYPWNLLFSYK